MFHFKDIWVPRAQTPTLTAAYYRSTESFTLGVKFTYISDQPFRSEEHTSELQSRETISYAVFCLKKKKKKNKTTTR